ncbi:hypothetical protein [Capnocytophaga canimorsus]
MLHVTTLHIGTSYKEDIHGNVTIKSAGVSKLLGKVDAKVNKG